MRAQFGSLIRLRRHQLGISQEELAGRAGLHRTYVADIERGARNPTLISIEKLATAFNVSIASLFASLSAEAGAPLLPVAAPPEPVMDIVLVEDNAHDASLAQRAFQKARLANRVYVIASGEAALIHVFGRLEPAHPPAARTMLILLDLNLPGMSGQEVLKRLKSDARTRDIPVVVLTATQACRDALSCLEMGAEAFLVKPLDFIRLCEVTPQLNVSWALCGHAVQGA
ncbi:MAG: response regulator [Lentisphaerae bacterium]|nr:response regulator [Lentisphaerota bacterium]